MKVRLYHVLFFLVLISPIINTVADTTINFFDRQDGFFHLGLLRGVYIILIIFIFHVKYGIVQERNSLIILGFLIYLFFLLPTSSRFFYSLNSGYIKWFGSLLFFPIGLYFFRDKNDLNRLSRVLIFSAIPIIVNFLFAQYFEIGSHAYIEDSIYYGGANIGVTNSLTFVVLSTPLYFSLNTKLKTRKKLFVTVIILLSLLSIVFILKRSAILGLALGFTIYLFFSPQKGRVINFLALISLIAFLTLPFYVEELERRIDARTGERNKIENEARYKEIFYVLEEFKEGNIKHKLFGTEPFNSRQFFGPKHFRKDRMIHGDLSSFLYGTGLIGLIWYVLIFLSLGSSNFLFYKLFFRNRTERVMIAVAFALLTSGFIITITGTGTIGERAIMYLTLGAIFGYLRNSYKEKLDTPVKT
jgi:hypothetical protein